MMVFSQHPCFVLFNPMLWEKMKVGLRARRGIVWRGGVFGVRM